MSSNDLPGVYVAALTPLKADLSPDLESIPKLLSFYAQHGCHGALLLGTTGEGPSFAANERIDIFRTGLKVREEYPTFRLLAGTGTPSLQETIELTKAAFEIGYEGVVVLPPYYFRTATQDGLMAWFSQLIKHAVPDDGNLLGYHIPAVSGVPLELDFLLRLKDTFPDQFAGIKDSSGNPNHAKDLGTQFGSDLVVLTGNDSLLSLALENQASGCITAMANLYSPILRSVWDDHQEGIGNSELQAQLTALREVLSQYQPYAISLKALIARFHGFPLWPVRPPLVPLSDEETQVLQSKIMMVENIKNIT